MVSDLLGTRVRWSRPATDFAVEGLVRAVSLPESETKGHHRIVMILEMDDGELRSYS